MSRLTPLRTRTCIAEPYNASVDETLELTAHVGARALLDTRTAVAEEDEVDRVAGALLVAQQRLPGALRIDAHRLRVELALDRGRVAAGKAQGGEQPQRDRLAVGQVEVGGRLERVRERVAEVEVAPGAVVVWVAEAERGLVRRGPAHVELPPREQLGLDELRSPLPPLALGERLEQRLVQDDSRRPVERADEVLPLRDVDAGLAADPRVD